MKRYCFNRSMFAACLFAVATWWLPGCSEAGGTELSRQGLVAHWTFDAIEGTRVDDASGGGWDGTIQGTHEPTEGVRGRALKLDGARSYVAVPDTESLDFSAATFSVVAWVNVYALTNDQQMVVGKNVYSANQREWGLMIDRDRRFRFYLRHADRWKTVESSVVPVPGRWYHVAATVDGGRATLYVNGEPQDTSELGKPIPNTAAPLTIGGINDDGRLRQMLTGAVDEVRLYRRALAADEIKAMHFPVTATHSVPADTRHILWDPSRPVPASAEARKLDGVKFVVVKAREPEVDGYNWLHGAAIVRHKGVFYASFGHNRGSENTATEEARGRKSRDDGRTWEGGFTIDVGDEPDLAVSHGVFLSHDGRLWAFHGSFSGRMQRLHTRAYVLDETNDTWLKEGVVAEDGFWPTQEPIKMGDGNWIMAGICVARGYGGPDDPAAVAISHGDDFTCWDVVRVPKPPGMEMWGESTVIVDGPEVLNIARYRQPLALASVSKDYGRTWTKIEDTNLPMAASKPYAGVLSTGQRYLICTTTADSGNRRSPLTIAASRPGEKFFSEVFCVRDAVAATGESATAPPPLSGGHPRIESTPACRLSYPYAAEYDGKLYVVYSNDGGRGGNRNSCELAIIPIASLAVADE